MPLGDVTYQNDSLDDLVGGWPATGAKYHLYTSDPALEDDPTDVELTSTGGYAAVDFDPSDWAAADDGTKSTTSPVSFGTATAEWSDVATYWAIVDSDGLIVFSDALTSPIGALGADFAPAFTPSLSFASDG